MSCASGGILIVNNRNEKTEGTSLGATCWRIGYYLVGLVLLAIGLTLNTKTGLGVSPIIAVPFSISNIWNLNFALVTLMVNMRLVPNPADGMADALGKRLNRGMGFGKNLLDLTCVAVTCVISLACGGRITAIGLGTLIAMVCVGRLIAFCQQLFQKPMLRRAGLLEVRADGEEQGQESQYG